MPLPLYGSGGRTFRTSAAIWPTCCLSTPLTTISVGTGTSKLMPCGAFSTTGCEKPTSIRRSVPCIVARYPTPCSSRRFSKPFVTPSTMFAISVRVRPCKARSSPRSVGRVTVIEPSSCSILIRWGTCCCKVPSGPLTITRPGSIATVTPAGTSIGLLPIRLMSWSPDEADDFAADSLLLRRAARDQPARSRQDRHAHSAEHARQSVLLRVDTAAGLGHPLQIGDDPLAAPAVLQVDHEGIEALAVPNVIVRDVALLLEDARDLALHARVGHLGALVQCLVGIPNPRQHVRDRVRQHCSPLRSEATRRTLTRG